MKRNNQVTYGKANASVKLAYLQYLFNAFFRRPVGYIIPIVYIIYLCVIFIIVPKAMNNGPLFIWNLTTFNIPIFSLFFIGASCAALAVTVFRISQEDGTELSISAKPLTKRAMVWLKVVVYLIIMLVVTALIILVAVLIKPIFGTYSSTNSRGITDAQYRGIILSLLVGNLVNILLFSGISILVSMLGGQVITMITSIGIAFLLVVLNFVYGKVVKTPADVITDTYGTTINSIRTYTKNQYDAGQKTEPQSFASIQCYVNEDGEELHHYDTYEYWLKAEAQAKTKAAAYLDFGNQLSTIFTSFGLENSSLADINKLPIGSNTTYQYDIDKSSHVTNKENIDNGNYPICIFDWEESQGKYYPCVTTLGPGLKGALSEWYLYSAGYGMEFDAVARISSGAYGYNYPGQKAAKALNNVLTLNMNDLYLTDEQKVEAAGIASTYLSNWSFSASYFRDNLTTSTSGIWEGDYSDLSIADMFKVNSKLTIYFMVYGQEQQHDLLAAKTGHSFPFSTAEVVDAYLNDSYFYRITYKLSLSTWYGFLLGTAGGTNIYSMLNISSMPYCESYCNLYSYQVKALYSTTAITAIWASIAIALFAIAIIIYKKKDFK